MHKLKLLLNALFILLATHSWGLAAAKPITVGFWGMRGSHAVSGPKYNKYGGHTSCVSIGYGSDVIVLDAGTGSINLSEHLKNSTQKEYHLILSHLHLDHIVGLTAFSPIWKADNTVHIYSGKTEESKDIEATLNDLFKTPFFPVDWKDFSAKRIHHNIDTGSSFTIDGIPVDTISLNHPGGGTGYKFTIEGRKVVYLCDTNHNDADIKRYAAFAKDADLLIYDATFTDEEYAKHPHFGHSTWAVGCEIANQAGVKYLALHHQEPHHSDAQLDDIDKSAKKLFPGAFVPKCGQEVVL